MKKFQLNPFPQTGFRLLVFSLVIVATMFTVFGCSHTEKVRVPPGLN